MRETSKIMVAIAIVVLISGCVQQIQGMQGQIVCNKPYIVVGTSCCLDQNDNAICDSDEQGEGPGASAPGYTPDMLESFPLEACGNYEWPPSCDFISEGTGRMLCEKCNPNGTTSGIPFEIPFEMPSGIVTGLPIEMPTWIPGEILTGMSADISAGPPGGISPGSLQQKEELPEGPGGCRGFECAYTCRKEKTACLDFCAENSEVCEALNLDMEEKTLSAPADRWIPVSLPLAGHVTDMAFDENGYLYAGTGSNGIYISKDLENWQEVNTVDMHVNSLDSAPNKKIYFGAGSIYRMDVDYQSPLSSKVSDLFEGRIGSGNWAGAVAVTDKGIFSSSRNGFYRIVNDQPEKIAALDGYIALAISSSRNYVFAAARRAGPFGGPVEKTREEYGGSKIFYSQDGINWAGTEIEGSATEMVAGEEVVYAATSQGVWESRDNGKTFSSLGLEKFVMDMEITQSGILYAATRTGVYKLEEGEWQETGFPKLGLQGDAREVIVSPLNGNMVVVGTAYGILKSSDGGRTFTEINEGFYDKNSVDLYVDPGDPNIVWSGTGCDGGIFRSMDGGLAWDLVGGEGIPGTTGMSTHYFMKTAVDPRDGRHLFVTTSDGLYETRDGGAVWALARDEDEYFAPKSPDFQKTGVRDGYHFHAITIDLKNPDTVFVGTGGSTILGDISSPELRILKSTDNGRTWRDVSNGLPDDPKTSFHSITIDPDNSSIIYAPTHGEQIGLYPKFEATAYGIYKSTDGGESWTAINNGLDEHDLDETEISSMSLGSMHRSQELEITQVAVDPADSNILYAGGHGIYKSMDGGRSWKKKLDLGEHHATGGGGHAEGINSIVIHPEDSNIVYASGMEGIYKSEDRGESWQAFNEGLPSEGGSTVKINSIAADSMGTVLYAGTQRHGVFKRGIG